VHERSQAAVAAAAIGWSYSVHGAVYCGTYTAKPILHSPYPT